jgi:hypothetical protein
MVLCAGAGEDTIYKHIKANSLYLAAFCISLSLLPGLSEEPLCTSVEEFKKLVAVAREDWVISSHYGNRKQIFIYSANKKELLITLSSKLKLEQIFNVDRATLNKYVNSGGIFLGSFVLREQPLLNVSLTDLCSSESDFLNLVLKAKSASKGGYRSHNFYIYSADRKQLLKKVPSVIKLAEIFNTSVTSINRYIRSGKVYFNSFVFRREPLLDTSLKEFYSSESDLVELVNSVYQEKKGYRAENIFNSDKNIVFNAMLPLARHFKTSTQNIYVYLDNGKIFRQEWRLYKQGFGAFASREPSRPKG